MKWIKVVCRAVTECVAIVALTLLAVEALKHGIDHLIIMSVALAIGGIAGYELKWLREKIGG